jgi:multidrug resistance efflux pump
MKEGVKSNFMMKQYYLRHAAPVMVWLLAAATVIWLFRVRAERFEIVGIARGQVRQVAASSTGRIKDIPFELFQPVRVGQTVATLDTICDDDQMLEADLKTRLASASAEAEHLISLLIPTQEKLQVDAADLQFSRESDRRRFEADAEAARLRTLQLQVPIGSDQITLGGLALEMKNLERLVAEDAIAPYELERVKTLYESTAKKIEENKRLLKQAQITLQQAEKRRDEFAQYELPQQSEDASLEAIRKQITVKQELMKGLLGQLAALNARREVELKAPIDGIIMPVHPQRNDALQQRPGEQVVRRPGEVVTAGDPILAVAESEPNEIVAYVSERQLASFRKGMSVELVKTREPAQIAESTITAVGPTIELIPQRLWRHPNTPQWGRPVLIAIPPRLQLVPGELVGIRRS